MDPRDCPGLIIESVSVAEFRPFAVRYGTSDEVGPIGTYYDSDKKEPGQEAARVVLLGAWGAGDLIGVACFTLARAREGQNYTCKLDSVIVRPEVRRQGLASLIVAHGFAMIMAEEQEHIATIYAHSVHPATVKLLRRHSFSDPGPVGAPISALTVTDDNRRALMVSLKTREQGSLTRLKHKCVRCKSGRKGAVPWCRTR